MQNVYGPHSLVYVEKSISDAKDMVEYILRTIVLSIF